MADGAVVYRFGPYELHSTRCALLRRGQPVELPDRCIAILQLLVARAGQAVHKEDVMRAGWNGAAVSDESITQAIWAIRSALAGKHGRSRYIVTERKHGYRFVAPVTRHEPARSEVAIDAIVTPYRVLSDAHLAVGTMSPAELGRARNLIRTALHAAPQSATANIDMATAGILTFEASRVEIVPDMAALDEALQYARAACDLAPHLGLAWSTLAYAQDLRGDRDAAIASAGLALTLDPNDAWHLLRLGFACFGEERRRASERLKTLCPQYAGAHWLEGTVLIARQAFALAIEMLAAGCELQDAQHPGIGAFNAVGLHLMRGNALAALGRDAEAIDEYRIELAMADPDHLYMPECCANSGYSIAAVHWRNGRRADAEAACRDALAFVPGHPLALVLLAALTNEPTPDPARCAMHAVDPILAQVAPLSLEGRHDDAADVAAELIADAAPGPQGWLLSADPLINATGHLDVWAQTLRLLHDRAI